MGRIILCISSEILDAKNPSVRQKNFFKTGKTTVKILIAMTKEQGLIQGGNQRSKLRFQSA